MTMTTMTVTTGLGARETTAKTQKNLCPHEADIQCVWTTQLSVTHSGKLFFFFFGHAQWHAGSSVPQLGIGTGTGTGAPCSGSAES